MVMGRSLSGPSQLHYPSRYCDCHLRYLGSWVASSVEWLEYSVWKVPAENIRGDHAAAAAVVVAELSNPR
jgi:hypothetical protein